MPKKAEGEILDDRFVALCRKADKEEYFKYCEAIGVNPSENIRDTLNAQVALHKASKA